MDDERRRAARASRWAGWSIACGLALVGGYATGHQVVTGVALLATLLCVSRWIEAARAPDAKPGEDPPPGEAPQASNIIKFRRPED